MDLDLICGCLWLLDLVARQDGQPHLLMRAAFSNVLNSGISQV
jgi:hypothetical protein